MRIKSFYSKTVETAIQDARAELGGDAVLVTSRKATPENSHLGTYEVVFGVLSENDTAATSKSGAEEFSKELKMLRRQMDEIRRQISGKASAAEPEPPSNAIRDMLLEADLAPQLAVELAEAAKAAVDGDDPEAVREFVLGQLRSRLLISRELGASIDQAQKVIVLVGPAGAGKTTLLAKLAVVKCMAERHSVRIISVDTHRVASHGLLQAYAGIIGVGISTACTLGEFRDALAEARGKDFVMVDTPGYSSGDEAAALEVAHLIRSLPNVEVHLVLPACTRHGDLARMAERFDVFQPDYLIFSKLDETGSYGSLISEALRQNKPVSYVSTGPGIPEDMVRPTVESLTSRVIESSVTRKASAA